MHTMDIQTTASDIANAHLQLRVGEALPLAQLSALLPAHTEAVYAAAWLGASMLGFIPQDAHCVANAWLAQSVRKKTFDIQDWPCDLQDFSTPPLNPSLRFPPCPHSLGLYAVLPDANWVARMVELEVPTVQLRFKSDDRTAIEREVKNAVSAVRNSHTRLFINDHWQQAIDAGAYGVHLGQEDMQEAPLEKIRHAGLRLGLSSHGYAEMLKAHAVQPSYLALGAVFPTTLKRMATAPQGLGRLAVYARLMHQHALVAIGGIDLKSLPAVMATGVGSVAFVRAIIGAADTHETVRQLTQTMDRHGLKKSLAD
jgi:thiamine-phosphate pyrophosphorylase